MLQLIDYSDKALAISGETFKYKAQLEQIGGKFNAFLKGANGERFKGFIFSKKHTEQLNNFILQINSEAPHEIAQKQAKKAPEADINAPTKNANYTNEDKAQITQYLNERGIIISEYSLANAYIEAHQDKNDDKTKNDYIKFYARDISIQSFFKFADKNLYRPCMNYHYFGKDGISIDSVAVNVSDYFECTPQDVVDFIIENPNGYNVGRTELQSKINDAFVIFYDKQININTANKIVQKFAEMRKKLEENGLLQVTTSSTIDINAPF